MSLPSASDLIQFKEVPLREATPKGRDPATGLPTLAGGRYVRERRLGEGSAGRVNLYRRASDARLLAGKVVSEPRLRRQQLGRGTCGQGPGGACGHAKMPGVAATVNNAILSRNGNSSATLSHSSRAPFIRLQLTSAQEI